MIQRSITERETRTLARAIFLSLAFLSIASLAADEVAVPDMETRIGNSGNSISPRALPELANLAPVTIPEGDKKPSSVAPPVQDSPSVESSVNPAKALDDAPQSGNEGVHGHASLGAGSSGLLRGAIAVACDRANDPDFALGFSHDSADGYGDENSGDGFFDRQTSADARVSLRVLSGEGSLALSVSDRTDGFQGKNADYYGMTHRSFLWDWSIDRIRLEGGESVFTFGVGSAGWLHDSFAEKSGGASSSAAEITDYSGFGFEPRASVAAARGSFDARLDAAFCYDNVTDRESAETKSADVALSLGFVSGSFTARTRVGVLAESSFDPLVPFDASISYDSSAGLIRALRLSGGLATDRQDPRDLARAEPFALLSGVPYHSADWNVAGLTSVAIREPLFLSLSATYRSTAYDRGILILSGDADGATSLIPVEIALRDSLATKASLEWRAPGLLASAGVSGEWLDRLNRKTLHTIDGSISVFEKSGTVGPTKTDAKGAPKTDAQWETTASASVPIDSGEYPFLGVSGTVRPARQFAVTLAFDDLLLLATGRQRERNGLYAERGGVVALSGTIDF